MHRDDPIRFEPRRARPFGARPTAIDARRQFRASMILMTLLVGVLGTGILANMLNAMGSIAQ